MPARSRRLIRVLIVAAAAGAGAPAARAVIVTGPQGRNAAEPAPSSNAYAPYRLTGNITAFPMTPVGPNTFVTARHIGEWMYPAEAGVGFRGQFYTIDSSFAPGGYVQVPGTDLVLARIKETFPDYARVYTRSDEVGKAAVLTGYGLPRGDEVVVGGSSRGWKWNTESGGSPLLSWGENVIDGVHSFGPAYGDTLYYSFSQGAGSNEGHLAPGDSGGGVFLQQGQGPWRLAGIHLASDSDYSTDGSNATAFDASLYNTIALFIPTGYNGSGQVTGWQPSPGGPGYSYSTRLSPHLDFLYQYIPRPAFAGPSLDVTGVTDNTGTVDVTGAVTVGAGGVLKATHVRAGGAMAIGDGGSVAIRPGGTVSKVAGPFSLAGSGTLDLADNTLVVQTTGDANRAAVLGQLQTWVKNAKAAGWQGPGIGSSVLAADSTGTMTLGVAPNRDAAGLPRLGQLNGVGLDASSVLVRYTLLGDLNLDRAVDAADYYLIDRGRALGLTGYWNGDANLSGGVPDINDYLALDGAFLRSAVAVPLSDSAAPGVLPGGPSGAGIPSVPEPASAALGLLASALTLARRRRQRA